MRSIVNRAAWAVVVVSVLLGCDRGPSSKPVSAEPGAVPKLQPTPAPMPILAAPAAPIRRALIERLRPVVQEKGAKELTVDSLVRIGRASVPALVELLHDADPALREQAAASLARIGPEAASAVSDLIAAIDDPEESVRKNAIRALGQIGPPAAEAVPTLIDTLKRLELSAPKKP